jgi:hypothetical protein
MAVPKNFNMWLQSSALGPWSEFDGLWIDLRFTLLFLEKKHFFVGQSVRPLNDGPSGYVTLDV